MKSKKTGLFLCFLLLLFCFPVAGAGASQEEDHCFRVADDFRTESLAGSDVFASEGVSCVGNAVHGLVPCQRWGDPVDAGEGYVVYRLVAEKGEEISEITLSFTAKVSHLSNGANVGNCLKAEGGTDGTFDTEFAVIPCDNGGERNFSFFIGNLSALEYYIKITLVNREGNMPLAYVGVKLFSVEIEYRPAESQQISDTGKGVMKEYFGDAVNYCGNAAQTVAGVRVSGNGYYRLPVDCTKGITVAFSDVRLKDHGKYDCWLSVALTGEPASVNFASRTVKGLYLMFFRSGEEMKCNVIHRGGEGKETLIVNGKSVGTFDGTIRITACRKSFGSARKLTLNVNGTDIAQIRSTYLTTEDITDGLSRTYLCYGAHGASDVFSAEDLHSMVIGNVSEADIGRPRIYAEIGQEYAAGEIRLPEITVEDESAVVYRRVRVFDGDGNGVEVENGVFYASAGEYLLVAEAEDEYGNFTRAHFALRVAEP